MKYTKPLRYWAFIYGIFGTLFFEIIFPSITFSQALDGDEINTIFEREEPDFNQRRLNKPSEYLFPSDVDIEKPLPTRVFEGINVTKLKINNANILGEQKNPYIKKLTESLVNIDKRRTLKQIQAEIDRITADFSYPDQPLKAAVSSIQFDKESLISRTLEITVNQSSLLDNEGNFLAQNIKIKGSTVFSSNELNKLTKLFEKKRVNLTSLENELVDDLEEKYRERGFLSTRATVASVNLDTGDVIIQAFEDEIAEIRIEGNKRLNKNYIRSRVMRRLGKPLNWNILEEQLQLLVKDPLIKKATPTILPDSLGKSILILNIVEAKAVAFSVSLKNSGGISSAPERLTYQISHSNLSGLGDTISFRYRDGLNFDDFDRGSNNNYLLTYLVPFNALGGNVRVRAINSNASLIESPSITSEFQQYDILISQPVLKNTTDEVILGLGFRYANSESFNGLGRIGISERSVLSFSQAYNTGNKQKNWELFSQFNFGLPVLSATDNPDPEADGEFFSWDGSIKYKQKLSTTSSLTIESEFKIAADPLLGGEQYGIGGLGSVRGYRRGVRGGDNGIRLSAQANFPVVMRTEKKPLFSMSPYTDFGYVWDHPDNPNSLDDQRFLAGAGLGLLLTPIDNLDVSLFFTVPFVDLDDRGNNIQDDGIYFSLSFKQPF